MTVRGQLSAISILTLALILGSGLAVASGRASTFYVDCSAAINGNGSEAKAWNTLAAPNAHEFHAGDRLLLRRGTTCNGQLAPQGSGTSRASVVLDAYGDGGNPAINGGANDAALKLMNQQYWEISNLEIVGGNHYGVYIGGNQPNSSLSHIYLKNLEAHGATFESRTRSDSGEVVVETTAPAEVLHDVVIDHVIAHDTSASQGIFVQAGGAWTGNAGAYQALGSDVTVENSTAHDVGGDGILITELTDGLLQHNVVYRSGMCATCTGSTPVGLWEWYCKKCTVQFNESYANRSWDQHDGGDFDIDYYNDDNVVQYNYGHDSEGYCISVFGADGSASRHNIVRYNVCSNDGRKASGAFQGEIFVKTWNGGSIDGVEIYNNTMYWNPVVNGPAFSAGDVKYSGSGSNLFMNNIVYSTMPAIVETAGSIQLDHNLYWMTSNSEAAWTSDGKTYSGLAAHQAGTRQDLHSLLADPRLQSPTYHANGMPTNQFMIEADSPARGAGTNVCTHRLGCSIGSRDFFGHQLPGNKALDIGAAQTPRN